jgi:hypothetical protein
VSKKLSNEVFGDTCFVVAKRKSVLVSGNQLFLLSSALSMVIRGEMQRDKWLVLDGVWHSKLAD